MSARRPAGASWESFVDRKIREAQERGEFDDLPGAGKPIADLDRPRDELWWAREKLRRENLSYVPPTVQARLERERASERIDTARSESDVRRIVTEANAQISQANLAALQEKAPTVASLDVEQAVQRWRQSHTHPGT